MYCSSDSDILLIFIETYFALDLANSIKLDFLYEIYLTCLQLGHSFPNEQCYHLLSLVLKSREVLFYFKFCLIAFQLSVVRIYSEVKLLRCHIKSVCWIMQTNLKQSNFGKHGSLELLGKIYKKENSKFVFISILPYVIAYLFIIIIFL